MLRLNNTKIDALLPSPALESKVHNLIKKLKELDEMTKKIQSANATIGVARAYFGTVLEDYPMLSDRLDADARIVRNPLFGSKLLKIQHAHEEDLKLGEREKVFCLLLKRRIILEFDSG